MKKAISFERVSPDLIRVGDILVCREHDDQHEHTLTQVIQLERDNTPGSFEGIAYDYQILLTCRHLDGRGDVTGEPPYRWHLFPWNTVTRPVLKAHGEDGLR